MDGKLADADVKSDSISVKAETRSNLDELFKDRYTMVSLFLLFQTNSYILGYQFFHLNIDCK